MLLSPDSFSLYLVRFIYHGKCEKESHQSAERKFLKTCCADCQSSVISGYTRYDHAPSKVILLTNNWVWNSPVFGRLVRMAGYYPVARGIENSMEYLGEAGEGRIFDCCISGRNQIADEHIKRFHKGAFFIAEKLDLDILPVLIHGTGYTMSKGDFLLKDGFITIKYLPRVKTEIFFSGWTIQKEQNFWGNISGSNMPELKEELEQPRFFREQLIYNYIYKGPVLEWYLRVKIRLEKDYQVFHDLLPKKGRISGYWMWIWIYELYATIRRAGTRHHRV